MGGLEAAERRRLLVEDEKLDELLLRLEDDEGPASDGRSFMMCQYPVWKVESGRVSKSVITAGEAQGSLASFLWSRRGRRQDGRGPTRSGRRRGGLECGRHSAHER